MELEKLHNLLLKFDKKSFSLLGRARRSEESKRGERFPRWEDFIFQKCVK